MVFPDRPAATSATHASLISARTTAALAATSERAYSRPSRPAPPVTMIVRSETSNALVIMRARESSPRRSTGSPPAPATKMSCTPTILQYAREGRVNRTSHRDDVRAALLPSLPAWLLAHSGDQLVPMLSSLRLHKAFLRKRYAVAALR